eukprot:g9716.t1
MRLRVKMEAEQIVRAHREAERRKTDAEGVRQAHLDQIKFQVGDIVLLYHPQVPKGVGSKLFTHWKGPYQIMEQTGPLNYKIRGYPPYTRTMSRKTKLELRKDPRPKLIGRFQFRQVAKPGPKENRREDPAWALICHHLTSSR